MRPSDPLPKSVLRDAISLLKQVTYALDLLDGTQPYCDVTLSETNDAERVLCRWFGESNPQTVTAIYEALEIVCPLSTAQNQEREPTPPMPIPPKVRMSVKRKEVERREPTSRKDLRLQKEQKRVEAIRKTIQGSSLLSSSLLHLLLLLHRSRGPRHRRHRRSARHEVLLLRLTALPRPPCSCPRSSSAPD